MPEGQPKIIKQPKFKIRIPDMKTIKEQKYLLLMSLPFVVWIIIFKYIPLWGWTMAFQKYMPGKSFFEQEWIGFKYFIIMFQDKEFYTVMRNTLGMSFLALLFGFTLPIILAILLNEVKTLWFKRTVQTISYLPHFVSWVIVASIFSKMLSIDNGFVNEILIFLHMVEKPGINFMAIPELFWWVVTSADVWKEIGWNSIIFLAAIAGISPELYEAAMVDGAGRFRRIWHITIPGILPTVIIILIMSIGNLINIGFEKQYLMRTSPVRDYSDVLDLFILDRGIASGRWAFGTAAGIFKSVISILLVFTANRISKKATGIRVV